MSNPKLWGSNSPTAGGSMVLSFHAGVPHKTAVLFIAGYKRADVDVPGLAMHLVPEPAILRMLFTDDVGELDLNIQVPSFMPKGITLYVQVVHPDPGAAKGLAVSNAVRIETK